MLGGAIAPLVAENSLVQLHAVIEAMVHQISEDPGAARRSYSATTPEALRLNAGAVRLFRLPRVSSCDFFGAT